MFSTLFLETVPYEPQMSIQNPVGFSERGMKAGCKAGGLPPAAQVLLDGWVPRMFCREGSSRTCFPAYFLSLKSIQRGNARWWSREKRSIGKYVKRSSICQRNPWQDWQLNSGQQSSSIRSNDNPEQGWKQTSLLLSSAVAAGYEALEV